MQQTGPVKYDMLRFVVNLYPSQCTITMLSKKRSLNIWNGWTYVRQLVITDALLFQSHGLIIARLLSSLVAHGSLVFGFQSDALRTRSYLGPISDRLVRRKMEAQIAVGNSRFESNIWLLEAHSAITFSLRKSWIKSEKLEHCCLYKTTNEHPLLTFFD